MKDIIAKRRKELGLTQQQLAEKLNISDKVISKWETGKSLPDTAIVSLPDACLVVVDRTSADAEFGANFGLYHTIHIAVQNGKL